MVLPLAAGSREVVIMIYIDPCNINAKQKQFGAVKKALPSKVESLV